MSQFLSGNSEPQSKLELVAEIFATFPSKSFFAYLYPKLKK